MSDPRFKCTQCKREATHYYVVFCERSVGQVPLCERHFKEHQQSERRASRGKGGE